MIVEYSFIQGIYIYIYILLSIISTSNKYVSRLRVNALFPLNPYLGHVEAMNHHALHLYGQDYFLRLFRYAFLLVNTLIMN